MYPEQNSKRGFRTQRKIITYRIAQFLRYYIHVERHKHSPKVSTASNRAQVHELNLWNIFNVFVLVLCYFLLLLACLVVGCLISFISLYSPFCSLQCVHSFFSFFFIIYMYLYSTNMYVYRTMFMFFYFYRWFWLHNCVTGWGIYYIQ